MVEKAIEKITPIILEVKMKTEFIVKITFPRPVGDAVTTTLVPEIQRALGERYGKVAVELESYTEQEDNTVI